MGNLENHSFNNRRFQMKKSISILLSALLTCTFLTSCNITKAVKGVTKSSQKKEVSRKVTENYHKEKIFEEESEEVLNLDYIKYRAANRAIIDAIREESDSIGTSEIRLKKKEKYEDILDSIKSRKKSREIRATIDAWRERVSIHTGEISDTLGSQKIDSVWTLQLREAIADYEKRKKIESFYETRKILTFEDILDSLNKIDKAEEK
jgi:predicted small secreted protein/Holliday junction resolvase-like predicted endonuclease